MMTKQKIREIRDSDIKTDMRAGKLEMKKKPKKKDTTYFYTTKTADVKIIWATK